MGNCVLGQASCGNAGKSKIFGVPLQTFWNHQQQCPRFLSVPIDFVGSDANPLQPGFSDRHCDQLEDICQHAESLATDPNGEIQAKLFYPETCACFISKFLTELPEPLLPRKQQRQLFNSMADPSITSHLCSDSRDNFDRILIIQVWVSLISKESFRRLVRCFSTLSHRADDQGVARETAEVMGPVICQLPMIIIQSGNKHNNLGNLRNNDDLISCQKLLSFVINNFNDVFENNSHRIYHTLNGVTASLMQSHADLKESYEKLNQEIETFKTKACTKIFNRSTLIKAFFGWRSISASSAHRQGPFQVIHGLKEDLKAVRLASMMQQKRITQLTSKLDLEIFENELSNQILSPKRKSTAYPTYHLAAPGSSIMDRSLSMRQSLSTPRNPRLSFTFENS